jgi:acetylxylan esterase
VSAIAALPGVDEIGVSFVKLTRSLLITAAAGLALSAVATNSASAVPAPGSGCAAVHVITARASTEAPGEGITGALVTQIVNAAPASMSTSPT